MSGKPAARLGDPTACPLPGHGTNPIAAGSPDVLFDGLPAARQGDPSACGGAMAGNVIPTVLINGMPAAVLGSVGNHGNVVVGGSGTILIGNQHTPVPFEAPAALTIFTHSHYILVEDQDGNPLQDIPYQLRVPSGHLIDGRTDAAGRSQIVSGKAGDTFDFFTAVTGETE